MNNLGSNSVLSFASAMQEKLDRNSHKVGWENCELKWLIKRAKQEIAEVERAIKNNKTERKILLECADVANFMMMVADNYESD